MYIVILWIPNVCLQENNTFLIKVNEYWKCQVNSTVIDQWRSSLHVEGNSRGLQNQEKQERNSLKEDGTTEEPPVVTSQKDKGPGRVRHFGRGKRNINNHEN
ncbi:hypothetical protein KIL84_011852 [Mauremys mutica]|uniref:Uncharacterized protein n=1 Tax=Mauremys mutica TaxID=74926 RepID=A0A9D3XFB5_9SAUR|nr:hypothetical protein KIL84_011852 [Mauremys mutica]